MPHRSFKVWLWSFATRIAAFRRPHPAPEQIARQEWPTDSGRIGLRLSERLRNAWRPRWLRLRRND